MTGAVAALGPLGIFLLMVPESACLPVPSELTLISAGFGVDQGWFSFPLAVAVATVGNLTGSLIAYGLGRHGALEKLPRGAEVAVVGCERLFARHGSSAVFVARLLPLARTFVSLPAGHAGVPLGRFVALTIAGCAIWSAAFVACGVVAGAGWHAAANTAGWVSLALVVSAAVWLGRWWRRSSRSRV